MPVSGSILCKKATQLHALVHNGDSEPPFQLFIHTHTVGWEIFAVNKFSQFSQLQSNREIKNREI